ncbi:MAG: VWA domain-containing protein [Bacteroidota bacterium]
MKSWLGIESFANPEALVLLLLIPVYIFWYMRYYRKQRLVIRLSYDPAKLHQPDQKLSLLRMIPRGFQLIALGLLILAIARPQASNDVVEQDIEGIDIMMVMDVSGSMEAQDYLPNRLEVAKQTATTFIEGRKYDQIGLVLFASEALSYAPLTLDHDFLKRMIKSINFNLLPRQGTAIGTAVSMGINRMKESQSPSKVMVLLTDGANNRGEIDPITSARLAAANGIRLYCIGIGRSVPNMQKTGLGSSGLDERTLERMATLADGNFYRVSNMRGLEQVFEEISRLETRQMPEVRFRQIKDQYPIFVKLAILFLIIAYLSMLTFIYNPLEQ